MQFGQISVAIGILTIISVSTVHADEQSYKIKLGWAVEVGQRFSVVTSVTIRSTTEFKDPNHQAVEPKKYSAELEATEKILAVEANSHSPTKVELTIKKLTRFKDPLVPEGTVIVVEDRDHSGTCTIDGKEVNPDVRAALGALVAIHSSNDPSSTDDILGTKEPRKVGESWKGDSALLAQSWAPPNASVKKEDVTCTVKFTAVEAGPHGAMLHVTSTTQMKNLHGDWHDGRRTNDGSSKDEMTYVVPADASDQTRSYDEHDTVTRQISRKDADGQTAEYQTSSERILTSTVTPILSK